ncbi:MAG: hypothetical protein JO189_24630 [Deltaproteobacteria bacterium]|nr:hypothetical protein [Deltaproteobacteria bacterium]
MSKILLDTDILSEYLKGHDRTVIRRAADYARQHGVFTFTSVTVHEIVYGLELKNATAQLQKALLWLNRNEQITPTALRCPARVHCRAGHFNCGAVHRLCKKTSTQALETASSSPPTPLVLVPTEFFGLNTAAKICRC